MKLRERLIVRVWQRMAEVYGHKWASSYGPAIKDGMLSDTARTWQKALEHCSPDEIAEGLQWMVDSGDGWPPTLPAFLSLCRSRPDGTHTAAYRLYKPLPPPAPNKEVRENEIAKMRRILGSSK